MNSGKNRTDAAAGTVGEVSLEKSRDYATGPVAPLLKAISLTIEAGTQLAIIGPSAAGKSTCTCHFGCIQTASGSVRLDGAGNRAMGREQLGVILDIYRRMSNYWRVVLAKHCPFRRYRSRPVVAAAQAAGIHDMVRTCRKAMTAR